jgi:hypothetical protein
MFKSKQSLIYTPVTYPYSSKKNLSLAYQALGTCLSPYKAFESLYTLLGCLGLLKPSGCLTNTSSCMTPFSNVLFTSIPRMCTKLVELFC